MSAGRGAQRSGHPFPRRGSPAQGAGAAAPTRNFRSASGVGGTRRRRRPVRESGLKGRTREGAEAPHTQSRPGRNRAHPPVSPAPGLWVPGGPDRLRASFPASWDRADLGLITPAKVRRLVLPSLGVPGSARPASPYGACVRARREWGL